MGDCIYMGGHIVTHLKDRMSLVNGYRVKCTSYKDIEKREKNFKERDAELGNWVKQKNERLARLHKLRTKSKKEKAVEKDTKKKNTEVDPVTKGMSVSIIEGHRLDGYTRLEDIPGDTESTSGSVTDLRNYQERSRRDCCCAVQ